jgi:3'(2'), 5'-bisphosphate nucleotidase
MVASGQADAFMRFMPPTYQEKIWDHAPGVLLVREAGGAVTDATGANPIFGERAVRSSNPRLIAPHAGIIAAGKKVHSQLIEAAKALLKEE